MPLALGKDGYGECIFFFKQKTAYEIKECDWSSDVCSSDLPVPSCFITKLSTFLYRLPGTRFTPAEKRSCSMRPAMHTSLETMSSRSSYLRLIPTGIFCGQKIWQVHVAGTPGMVWVWIQRVRSTSEGTPATTFRPPPVLSKRPAVHPCVGLSRRLTRRAITFFIQRLSETESSMGLQ